MAQQNDFSSPQNIPGRWKVLQLMGSGNSHRLKISQTVLLAVGTALQLCSRLKPPGAWEFREDTPGQN
jgi:hypothetical protein